MTYFLEYKNECDPKWGISGEENSRLAAINFSQHRAQSWGIETRVKRLSDGANVAHFNKSGEPLTA